MDSHMRIGIVGLALLAFGCTTAPDEHVGEQASALPVLRPPVGFRPAPRVVFVPSQYRTIQAAVDALPAGGRVVVAAGTYVETVFVSGDRSVTIDGAGATRTKIVGPDPSLGTINYAVGASGVVSDVGIAGGSAGVVGSVEVFENPADPGLVPGPVTLRHVTITGSPRGVSGVFPSLTMDGSFVWDARDEGVRVSTRALSLRNVEVHRTGGAGVQVTRFGTGELAMAIPCSYAITGGKVADTGKSGIALEGRCATTIQDVAVTRTHVAGIDLVATGPAAIDSVDVSHTGPRLQPEGQVPALAAEFGDAIRIWSSTATVRNSHLAHAHRAGIAVMGCGDAAEASASVGCSVLECNALDLVFDAVDPWSPDTTSCEGGARVVDEGTVGPNEPPPACVNQCSGSSGDTCTGARLCKAWSSDGITPVPVP